MLGWELVIGYERHRDYVWESFLTELEKNHTSYRKFHIFSMQTKNWQKIQEGANYHNIAPLKTGSDFEQVISFIQRTQLFNVMTCIPSRYFIQH